MAHKKGQSSSRNGRDSKPKMLGIKAFGGEYVTAGSIRMSDAAETTRCSPSRAEPSSSEIVRRRMFP